MFSFRIVRVVPNIEDRLAIAYKVVLVIELSATWLGR